jgi:uncharacterized protein YecT (DUF1311 family)
MNILRLMVLAILPFLITGCFKNEMNVKVGQNGLIDVNATYDLSALKPFEKIQKTKFDCATLSQNDEVAPIECKDLGNSVIFMRWVGVSGANFNALKISNNSFFKTYYELNLNEFMRNFESSMMESKKDKDIEILKSSGASYILKISMPGQISTSSDFVINQNIAQVDLINAIINKKQIILKSESFNTFLIIGIALVVLGLSVLVILLILKNKNQEKFNKFKMPLIVTSVVFAILSAFSFVYHSGTVNNFVGLKQNDINVTETNITKVPAYTETNMTNETVKVVDSNATSASKLKLLEDIKAANSIMNLINIVKIESYEFASAESNLNATLKVLNAKMSQEEKEVLIARQTEWEKTRDLRAVNAAAKGWSEFVMTITNDTKLRIQELSQK